MPLAPVIAWNLTPNPVSRSKSLTIDGLDVIAQTGGNYGTDVSSITVTEAGDGDVSSMSFTIVDPTGAITLSTGQVVRYWDNTLDLPIFTGLIEEWQAQVLGVGREITVNCVGIEVLLDWLYVPAVTYGAALPLWSSVYQTVISAAVGLGLDLLRWGSGGGLGSTVTSPVDSANSAMASQTVFTYTTPAGSLRKALQAVADAHLSEGPWGTSMDRVVITIDFWGGIRVSAAYGTTNNPYGDYSRIQLKTDGTGFNGRPASTSYGVNDSGHARGVWVTGGNAASTGLVMDGQGVRGPVITASESSLTTTDQRDRFGLGVLGAPLSASGSVVSEGGTSIASITNQRRAGGWLDLTDPQVGLTTETRFRIVSITKTFASSGEEEWVIEFGNTTPSASRYIRSLVGV